MSKRSIIDIKEIAFISCLSLCFIFFNSNNSDGIIKDKAIILLTAMVGLIVVKLFSKQLEQEGKIYSNKKAIYPFIANVLIVIGFGVYELIYKVNFVDRIESNWGKLILVLCAGAIPFVCYLFGIKMSNFKWKISLKQIIVILVVCIVWGGIRVLFLGKYGLRYYSEYNENTLTFIIYTLIKFITPGFFEEIAYRGFLMSALLSYNLDIKKINMIQAVVFGLIHFSLYYGYFGFMGVFLTGIQALLGYVLGEIYIRTKSLTPCIIFHVFLDVI
ncbi:CPBP family intramembrane glutamic endopeptidase [Clostridium intestinale]|uniref:CAAX amino protease n=1 Tax=Clostridium intestinale URNW TaxID=1294142 RepID=U2PYY0_9CLOT|nr:CPBP family intramembrane glutamic endopeptidase [Clostridium intestinale]ERK28989.1 CAAX amino protease [Clostridium intestinale URNW]